ncbi:MAG: hypothetical protein ACTSVA_06475 [Candidatus Njordarchaeales archaeon]
MITEISISVLIFLNGFIVYRIYDMSTRIAKIEEDIKWIIKMINGFSKKA